MDNKISEKHIEELYRLFAKFAINNKSFELNEVRNFIESNKKLEWNKNSLEMYISALYYMIRGEIFKRSINKFAKNFFIENICKDFDKNICENAKKSLQLHEEYMKNHQNIQSLNKEDKSINDSTLLENVTLNQILYGPPGTGKTYKTIELAVKIVDNEFYKKNKDDREKLREKFKELKDAKQIEFITFHQSYSYEDFIEGIKPDLENKDGNINYKIEDGVFKRIVKNAENNLDKNYVIIIDEINRGNIAKIFGELITLIEEDKRIGNDEDMRTTLPYSKEPFGVPKNLYIIGTMNTADKSIAPIDTALRRRFEFVEMMPKYDELNKDLDGVDLQKMLKAINIRIEALYDREHQIGHSYLINVKDIKDLKKVFKYKILPLLAEYFYEDFENIKKILNDNGFIREKGEDKYLQNIKNDYERIYEIVDVDEIGDEEFIKACKKIYSEVDNDTNNS